MVFATTSAPLVTIHSSPTDVHTTTTSSLPSHITPHSTSRASPTDINSAIIFSSSAHTTQILPQTQTTDTGKAITTSPRIDPQITTTTPLPWIGERESVLVEIRLPRFDSKDEFVSFAGIFRSCVAGVLGNDFSVDDIFLFKVCQGSDCSNFSTRRADIHTYTHALYTHTCTHIYIRMHMHTYAQTENPSNNASTCQAIS